MNSRTLRILGLVGCFILPNSALAGEKPAVDLIALGKSVQARVEKMRGLKAIRPLRWRMTSKPAVRAYLKEVLAEQYAPGELENEGLAMQALGFLPRDLHFPSFVMTLYEEQVAGYYDPKREVFYLAEWIPAAMQETIIAHELTHALQDQHFNTDEFVDRIRGNSDAMVARAAVVEGEATLIMLLDAVRSTGIQMDLSMLDMDGPLSGLMSSLSAMQYAQFAQAPRAVREQLLFPYLQGLQFISYARKVGGWPMVDRLYARLPASSEQILHPEKYFLNPDQPISVSLAFLDELITAPWERIYEDVLGEFMSRMLLDALDDKQAERRATAGWGGDRFRVYRAKDRLAWVGLWEWDTESDAVEWAGAYAESAPKSRPELQPRPIGPGTRMTWHSQAGGSTTVVARGGRRVLIVDGLEPRATEKIVQAVFPTSKSAMKK